MSFMLINNKLTCSFWLPGCPVTVHTQHVLGDFLIALRIHLIQNNEEQVKSGEQGILEANILHWGFILVILGDKYSEINVQHKTNEKCNKHAKSTLTLPYTGLAAANTLQRALSLA